MDDRSTLRDEDLLALIAQRDELALGVLYDRYGRLVFSIALRVTGDRETAEEITQDVFQIVWQQVEGFRAAAGTVPGWIVGITRHRAIDETRSRRHKARQREAVTEETTLEQMPAGDGNDVEQQAVLRSDVNSALSALPMAQRQTIELAYYGGLTCVEIASTLGTSVGTVKTRMRLGLVKLRAIFLPAEAEQ